MNVAQDLSLDHVEPSVQQPTNPFATIWLGILALLFIGTLACTAILVAWPILATLIAG